MVLAKDWTTESPAMRPACLNPRTWNSSLSGPNHFISLPSNITLTLRGLNDCWSLSSTYTRSGGSHSISFGNPYLSLPVISPQAFPWRSTDDMAAKIQSNLVSTTEGLSNRVGP